VNWEFTVLHRNTFRKTKVSIIATIRALSERGSKIAQDNQAEPTERNIFTTTVCILRRVFLFGKYQAEIRETVRR
jgi:hypothetical protein